VPSVSSARNPILMIDVATVSILARHEEHNRHGACRLCGSQPGLCLEPTFPSGRHGIRLATFDINSKLGRVSLLDGLDIHESQTEGVFGKNKLA
jgi:hypothetical protein